MKHFEEPNVEVVQLCVEDVVTTSQLPPPPGGGGNIGDNCVS